MVAAYSGKEEEHVKEIIGLIKNNQIGGLVFFQGGPVRQAVLTNHYQALSKVPLLIGMDAEWGLAMRLDSTVQYPRQMTLGSIQNDTLIYRMASQIAQQCKRLGVHLNFAPVVDVNNNPSNPVISNRSFGEDKTNVAKKGLSYMRGLQDNGVLANAKHFPGHGDTDADSHTSLPTINHSASRLHDIELHPFRSLIDNGLGSVMVAHLNVPSLDSGPAGPSSLSRIIVSDLLQRELGFQGLVITDGLNMQGVNKSYPLGELDAKALLAGNDILLLSEDVPKAMEKIKLLIESGEITQEAIDKKCHKILKAKEWAGLANWTPIETKNLVADLNSGAAQAVNHEVTEASLVLLNNNDNLLPLKRIDTLNVACIIIGDTLLNPFHRSLLRYKDVQMFRVPRKPSQQDIAELKRQVSDFDVVIVSLHKTTPYVAGNFGISNEAISLVRAVNRQNKVILNLHANPYSLNNFRGVGDVEALILSHEDTDVAQDAVAQLIFGGIGAKGKLSVSASEKYLMGTGIYTEPIRLGYSVPESVGMSSVALAEIDKIATLGITSKAYPGCQVLVAKNSKVVYSKSFGHHTYEQVRPVTNSDIYDLASITKILASTPALMRLQDEGRIKLDFSLCDYIGNLVDTTQYSNINLREMLAHQAGLVAWIPFYIKTLHKGQPRYDLYSVDWSETYSNRVAEKLYMNRNYRDTIFSRILETRFRDKNDYMYSDLGYYFVQAIVESETQQHMNDYMDETFYSPLGLQTMGYLPRQKFPLERIVPTEYDMSFRKQLVHGDVHDPGAAMLGGVAGHAGVFSNANDLAIMMQMYLNGGVYGGERFLTEKTLEEFTSCQFCSEGNRRGAGFDRPTIDGVGGPTCDSVSQRSFGHSGFTGTITWADPDEDVVYVFLSNRVYPNAENKKLLDMGIRTRIQAVIYDSITKAKTFDLSKK